MPCYHPLSAYQTAGGDVVFCERGDIVRSLFLPCGQCIGCRLERSRQWAVRIMHEQQLYEESCVVTLTFDNEHVPRGDVDWYPFFQKFMKRLRKKWEVRYFVCGEYGEKEWRPHFHACIFGYGFLKDRVKWKKSDAGFWQYRCPELDALWSLGVPTVGDLTFEYAQYVAKYILKKVTGTRAKPHYERVDESTGEIYELVPEFVHMSLKPGIGAEWFNKFGSEVYPFDRVIARGVPTKPPKYYDRLLERCVDAEMVPAEWLDVPSAIKEARILRFNRLDNTEERLRVKEIVAKAGANLFKRR